MSMILDALTRAEHERQLEQQPDLNFVNHAKPEKSNSKKIWVWVACALLANALILFIVIRSLSNDDPLENQSVNAELQATLPESNSQANVHIKQNNIITTNVEPVNKTTEAAIVANNVIDTPQENIASRPLAMEANNSQVSDIDRPLFYESKQPNGKSVDKPSQKTAPVNVPTKKGNVSFSATELSADNALPITNKPKLLIDQGDGAQAVNSSQPSGNVLSLRDLPQSTRNNLQQYEVNVHVFDSNPLRRFVLINMDKYKEGDRIANNGPLVEQITATGVVVDYGNGRALLPPK